MNVSEYEDQGRAPVPHVRRTFGFLAYQQGLIFTDENVIASYVVLRDVSPGQISRSKSRHYRINIGGYLLRAPTGELIKMSN